MQNLTMPTWGLPKHQSLLSSNHNMQLKRSLYAYGCQLQILFGTWNWLMAWSSQHKQCVQSASLLQFAYAAKEEYASFGLQLSQQTEIAASKCQLEQY